MGFIFFPSYLDLSLQPWNYHLTMATKDAVIVSSEDRGEVSDEPLTPVDGEQIDEIDPKEERAFVCGVFIYEASSVYY